MWWEPTLNRLQRLWNKSSNLFENVEALLAILIAGMPHLYQALSAAWTSRGLLIDTSFCDRNTLAPIVTLCPILFLMHHKSIPISRDILRELTCCYLILIRGHTELNSASFNREFRDISRKISLPWRMIIDQRILCIQSDLKDFPWSFLLSGSLGWRKTWQQEYPVTLSLT